MAAFRLPFSVRYLAGRENSCQCLKVVKVKVQTRQGDLGCQGYSSRSRCQFFRAIVGLKLVALSDKEFGCLGFPYSLLAEGVGPKTSLLALRLPSMFGSKNHNTELYSRSLNTFIEKISRIML